MLVEQGGFVPTLSSWAEEGKPIRLLQKSIAKDDPDPKAISCYALYLPELVTGRRGCASWMVGPSVE